MTSVAKRLTKYCLSVILILTSFVSVASEYIWVAPDARICNHPSCECTEVRPCAFDDRLVAKLKPGNKVRFHSGTYTGFVVNNVHGTKEEPIHFVGPAEGLPAKIVGPAPNIRDTIEIRSSAYLTIEQLQISEAQRAGIRINNSHNITVKNSILEKNSVWGIFTNHANHFNATGNSIIGPAEQHGIYQSNSGDHVQIIGNYIINFDGCAVHFNGDLSMGGAKQVIGDGVISDIVVKDNFFAGNGKKGGSAINLDGVDGGQIENNILFDNKATGIAVFKHDGAHGSKNITIERNLIIMPPRSRFAVNFNQSEGNNIVRQNIVIAQDRSKGVYDTKLNQTARGELISSQPFRAIRNSYLYRGLFALFNGRHHSRQQLQQQGEDTDSTLLELNHMLLPEANDYSFRIPSTLARQMTLLNVAIGHPYQHLLLIDNDGQ